MSSPLTPQRGFTMALALALAVVMGLMLLKAAPPIATEIQRENEAELVFRGEAIATALKMYQSRTGRYPTDLEEVMKIKPRILRQKYKDPMTSSGVWDYLTQVQPGASGNKQGLPIVGVRSRGDQDSFRKYQNKTLVRDWVFSADPNLLVGGSDSSEPRRRIRNAMPPGLSRLPSLSAQE